MKYDVITISREFGSGGRTIGKEVAEKLGIPCYDQEIIEKLAEESGFSKDYIEDKGEYATHKNWFANAFASSGTQQGSSNQDYLWVLQRRIILDLAKAGPCVIVGRCADYILDKEYNCLKVFIHASIEKRIPADVGAAKRLSNSVSFHASPLDHKSDGNKKST